MTKNLLIGLCVLILACGVETGSYAVRIRNAGLQPINDVRLSYGRYVSNVGVLIGKAADTDIAVREPLPRTAVLEWTAANGEKHRQKVVVALPATFREILVFEIDGENHVSVSAEARPGSIGH